MLVEIIKIMRLIFFPVVILSLFSCNKSNIGHTDITLVLDKKESQYNDERFLIDSIFIEYNDSIKITRYTGNYQFQSIYHKKENGIYEIRERCNEELECFGADTILTFYKSDTTFIYDSAYDFMSTVFQYTLGNSKYNFKHTGNIYETVKQSLIDTTYTETFLYDDNFIINKFINTWQENRCVYVREN